MDRHAPRHQVDHKARHTGAILMSAVVIGLAVHITKTPAERGKYLVTIVGCNDCHTPLIMGPKGLELDMSRMLSGHPSGLKMPAPPALPEGPRGITYSAKLTPHEVTGYPLTGPGAIRIIA